MVLGFIVYWPIGLAVLGWKFWQKKSGYPGDIISFGREKWGNWANWARGSDRWGFSVKTASGFGMGSTGNRAFDEWRAAELARLEEERHRPIFHDLPQGLALALAEDAGSARRFAGQETIRIFGVETDNPVAHDLHPDPADPRRIRPRAAIINLGQCQETPGLIGVTRSPRQHAQANRVKVRAKRNRSRHGKLSQKLFAMVNQINADSGIRLRSQTFRDLVLVVRTSRPRRTKHIGVLRATRHDPNGGQHSFPIGGERLNGSLDALGAHQELF